MIIIFITLKKIAIGCTDTPPTGRSASDTFCTLVFFSFLEVAVSSVVFAHQQQNIFQPDELFQDIGYKHWIYAYRHLPRIVFKGC